MDSNAEIRERRRTIFALRRQGLSPSAIGRQVHLSRERVGQLIKKGEHPEPVGRPVTLLPCPFCSKGFPTGRFAKHVPRCRKNPNHK